MIGLPPREHEDLRSDPQCPKESLCDGVLLLELGWKLTGRFIQPIGELLVQ